MSDHNRPTKKEKTLDSWLKKIREDQNSSTPLASNEHHHVTSPILEPREFVPTASASNTESTILNEHHHVTSPIPESIPIVDSTPRDSIPTPPASSTDSAILNEQPHVTSLTLEDIDFVVGDLERDPGKRIQIYEYLVNQRDHIRCGYIKLGPYQPKLFEYPRVRSGTQYRRFNYSWFTDWPWLEYSPSKNKAFCFPCFLFAKGPKVNPALTTDGFNDWKRVKEGRNCVFLNHIGGPCSLHNNCVKCVEDLMKTPQHVDIVMNRQNREEILKNFSPPHSKILAPPLFITGGSSSIGLALAHPAASEGAKISILARSLNKVEEAKNYIQLSIGIHVAVFAADVRDYDAVSKAIEAAGPIDVLVVNQGVFMARELEKQVLDEVRFMVDVNLIGSFNMIKAALPGMKDRKDRGTGSTSLMSSQAGQVGIYGYVAYSASKFGLRGLAEALQQEVIADDIRVSLIFPPDTDTPRLTEVETSGAMKAKDVAKKALDGIKSASFIVPCNFEGLLLSIASAGLSPQRSFIMAFVEVVAAGVIWIAALGFQ